MVALRSRYLSLHTLRTEIRCSHDPNGAPWRSDKGRVVRKFDEIAVLCGWPTAVCVQNKEQGRKDTDLPGRLLPFLSGPVLRLTCLLFMFLVVNRGQKGQHDCSSTMQPNRGQIAMHCVFWHPCCGLWHCRWTGNGPMVTIWKSVNRHKGDMI